ncbi:crotonase/enoyl-CoA hydratase family protein [Candidatus Poriferisocius sp.]|uniref:crotonase/enoyl-CoA hydratase family protein n=1 Tax=Candidatus Poriferisocius sp. TaxID=3101276 RepID=UPI003B019960
MTYEEIVYDVVDSVGTITLNRPARLNAFTPRMMFEMIDAFDQVDADDEVRAVIVTGAGRGFCAGADLGSGAETFNYEQRTDRAANVQTEDISRIRDGGGRVTLRIFECLKPVIAAINGPAVGVGATMTLPMDIRLGALGAKMGFVFARRGLVPEACSSFFLPKVVGLSTALEWTFSGRVFPIEDAHEAGLVRSVHAPDDLLPAARALAAEIAANTSAVSVAATRQLLWRMAGADHPMEAHKIDSRLIWQLGKGADVAEGVMSFVEKRPAEFTMRPSADLPDVMPWWTEREFE